MSCETKQCQEIHEQCWKNPIQPMIFTYFLYMEYSQNLRFTERSATKWVCPLSFCIVLSSSIWDSFQYRFFVSSQSFCMVWCNGNDETSTYMNANTEQTSHTCPFCFCCGVSSSSIYVCKGFAFVKVPQNNSFLSVQNSNVAYSPPSNSRITTMLTDSQSPLTCPDSPVPEGVHPQSLMLSPTPKTPTKDMDPFTVDKNIAHPHSQTTTSSASVFWVTMVVLFGQNPAPYGRDTCYHLQLCSHVWNNYQPYGPYVRLFLAGLGPSTNTA